MQRQKRINIAFLHDFGRHARRKFKALDGVYASDDDGRPQFHPLLAPEDADVAAVASDLTQRCISGHPVEVFIGLTAGVVGRVFLGLRPVSVIEKLPKRRKEPSQTWKTFVNNQQSCNSRDIGNRIDRRNSDNRRRSADARDVDR